ncbi:metallophosphoesterase [Clostridium sp. AUH-JLR23]|uniref:metallophosphoesterase n=1 Tax=Clostridium sp. AUH-JLR23 TaxID=1505062 RepID=UPI003565F780
MHREIKKIINQLKRNDIDILNVPEKYFDSKEIVLFERESGLRIPRQRGFDVIADAFFVEEDLLYIDNMGNDKKKSIITLFEDFDSYYNFLNGDIYNNACYTYCQRLNSVSHKIDLEKLMMKKSFVEETIDDYSLILSKDEKDSYNNGQKIHKLCQKWTNKFNKCQSYEEFIKVVNSYKKSVLNNIIDVTFFFFQYIFADSEDKNRFSIIMQYMSTGAYPQYKLINALCLIYNPDDVMKSFDYSSGARGTIYKHKKKLRDYITYLKVGEIKFYSHAFFDKNTHYYCEETKGYQKDNNQLPIVTICRYFETFDEFINYRNGDLTHCDLSGALECDIDFSKYNIDNTTKLPINANAKTTYFIEKKYDNDKFYVTQKWYNEFGCMIKEYKHSFNYFFDFVAFLKGDLSEANLLFCDGLIFLEQWDEINFANAKLKSALCKKFNLKFDTHKINTNLIESFSCVEHNEEMTLPTLQSFRDLEEDNKRNDLSPIDTSLNYGYQRVQYISDLHLMHKLQNACCQSKEDILYVIKKIANTIALEAGNILLINGDVSSDFTIFKLFVKSLSYALDKNTTVVFTLGNHELWDFPKLEIDQIVTKYRNLLNEYGMYLLHNDLLYKESNTPFSNPNTATHLIKYHDLCQMDKKQISVLLRSARYVILGGLGFSGYNTKFNANNGIYRKTINRECEIKESKIFEDLYNYLHPILSKKNTIILTHTPKIDWCQKDNPDQNYIYVSGHTHKNFFHDDGEYRIYSDNQIGYYNKNLHLKSFLINTDYDCFSDYDDGIFEITKEQYNDFYCGKNILMTFQREINILYMLKKNGYYCFIHKSKKGTLTILNGGAMKKLNIQNIQYYYDNMDAMISMIKKPLDKFSTFQRHISDTIKKIGGYGKIHGCIIDIDFYNHIYVNPIDLSITGYYATDIINKIAYPSIPSLLENNCPTMFNEYIKLLEDHDKNSLILKQKSNITTLPQIYLDTNIYKASREIKKMQRLNSNILSSWYENIDSKFVKINMK